MTQAPSRDEFDRFVRENYRWRALDEALYHLCNPKWNPQIDLYDRIRSSVEGIGLGYRALPNQCPVESITEALWIIANGTSATWPIPFVESLPVGPWLTRVGMENSIKVHDQLVSHLRQATRFQLWVFASKWLHFHRPGVPIYDNNAATGITAMEIEQANDLTVPPGLSSENPYPEFCRKLASFARHLGQPPVTAREIDVYLYVRGREQGETHHGQS